MPISWLFRQLSLSEFREARGGQAAEAKKDLLGETWFEFGPVTGEHLDSWAKEG